MNSSDLLITKILIHTLESSGAVNRSGLIVVPAIGENSTGAKVIWTPGLNTELDCKKSGLKGGDLISLCIDEAFARSGN